MKFDTIPFNLNNYDLMFEYKTIITLYKVKRKQLQMLTKDTVEKLDNYIYTNIIMNSKTSSKTICKKKEFSDEIVENFNLMLYNPLEINIDIKFNYFKHLFNYPYICVEQNTPIKGLSKHHLQYPYRDEYFRIIIFDCWDKEERGFIGATLIDTEDELKKDNNEHYCKKLFNYYNQSKYKDYLEYGEKKLTLNEKVKKILCNNKPLYKNCYLHIQKNK